jgi:hypothetical protein
MAQVPANVLHKWVDGEIVTGQNMNNNQEVLRAAINDADSKTSSNTTQISSNATIIADHKSHGARDHTDLTSASDFATHKTSSDHDAHNDARYATKTDIANVQAGVLVDQTVSTSKLVDLSVTNPKIGAMAVDSTKIDASVASSDNVTTVTNQVNTLNTRVTNSEINLTALSLQVAVLKGSATTGVTQNICLESLVNTDDITIVAGMYDSANHKIYLP